MKVAELIQLLQSFDPQMKVLMTRSDFGLEDIVAPSHLPASSLQLPDEPPKLLSRLHIAKG